MLLHFRLQNLATIKELEAEFDSGFSILTGETGAGKSIMIDAMLLVLGGRGDTGLVRTGEDSTVVEAVFDLSETEGIRNQLEDTFEVIITNTCTSPTVVNKATHSTQYSAQLRGARMLAADGT